MSEPVQYRIEILATGETRWAGNSMVYATEDEAWEAARGLYNRWMAAERYRAVPLNHPQREAYVAGSDVRPAA